METGQSVEFIMAKEEEKFGSGSRHKWKPLKLILNRLPEYMDPNLYG
jgi:hypothetical protein